MLGFSNVWGQDLRQYRHGVRKSWARETWAMNRSPAPFAQSVRPFRLWLARKQTTHKEAWALSQLSRTDSSQHQWRHRLAAFAVWVLLHQRAERMDERIDTIDLGGNLGAFGHLADKMAIRLGRVPDHDGTADW